MSRAVQTASAAAPELRFRLPGRWFDLNLADGPASEASARAIAESVMGTSDEKSAQRARLRRSLVETAEAARRAETTTLLFTAEIARGAPFPVVLAVSAPARLQIPPSVDTAPEAVLAALTEAARFGLDPAVADTIQQVGGPSNGTALRTHRLEPPDPASDQARELSASYFVPVQGTRQVLMVSLSTPLGAVPDVMLRLFDTLLAIASFSPPPAPSAPASPPARPSE